MICKKNVLMSQIELELAMVRVLFYAGQELSSKCMNLEDLQLLGSSNNEKQEGENVSDQNFSEILSDIEQACIQYPSKTIKPFVLIPTGLIASGKTTIIKQIAEHYALVIIRTDDIREYLERRGYNLVRTVEFAYHLIIKSLKQGYGVAIDADIVQDKDRRVIKKVSADLRIPLISVKVITPENVILSRLDENNSDRAYRGKEAIERYFERVRLHDSRDLEHDVIFKGDENLVPQLDNAYAVIDRRLVALATI